MTDTTELPPLPEQCGWLLVMHGHAISFANNAEKAAGMSPGASAQAFTAHQMQDYARAYAAEAVRVARKPLTDEQIDAILDRAGVPELPPEWARCDYEIARAIEAAHGITGGRT